MGRTRDFLKRHKLWLGFVAAFLPLAVLLFMQFQWLAKLEETSAIARQATLSSYVDGLLEKVLYFYEINAIALNVPGSLFTEGKVEK